MCGARVSVPCAALTLTTWVFHTLFFYIAEIFFSLCECSWQDCFVIKSRALRITGIPGGEVWLRHVFSTVQPINSKTTLWRSFTPTREFFYSTHLQCGAVTEMLQGLSFYIYIVPRKPECRKHQNSNFTGGQKNCLFLNTFTIFGRFFDKLIFVIAGIIFHSNIVCDRYFTYYFIRFVMRNVAYDTLAVIKLELLQQTMVFAIKVLGPRLF